VSPRFLVRVVVSMSCGANLRADSAGGVAGAELGSCFGDRPGPFLLLLLVLVSTGCGANLLTGFAASSLVSLDFAGRFDFVVVSTCSTANLRGDRAAASACRTSAMVAVPELCS
jgi:hypothetical protein